MSHGDCLQTLAYDRVRYQAVEERVAATGSVRAARRFARAAAPDGLGSIRSFAALHRAADRADHAHRAARAGQQVSQLDPYAAGFLNCYAAARFQRDASLSGEAALHVHLPVRGHLHGGLHAQDLQLYQRP
uniref:(northern house mosquito) hypothetical protein n=1 Tax=Culex pipiens TaxID=7175 RepID=A0A8D8BBR5_CULPI